MCLELVRSQEHSRGDRVKIRDRGSRFSSIPVGSCPLMLRCMCTCGMGHRSMSHWPKKDNISV